MKKFFVKVRNALVRAKLSVKAGARRLVSVFKNKKVAFRGAHAIIVPTIFPEYLELLRKEGFTTARLEAHIRALNLPAEFREIMETQQQHYAAREPITRFHGFTLKDATVVSVFAVDAKKPGVFAVPENSVLEREKKGAFAVFRHTNYGVSSKIVLVDQQLMLDAQKYYKLYYGCFSKKPEYIKLLMQSGFKIE
jgi:hypothetical protein